MHLDVSRIAALRSTPHSGLTLFVSTLLLTGLGAWLGLERQSELALTVVLAIGAVVAYRVAAARMGALETALERQAGEADAVREELRDERRFLDGVLESCADPMVLFDRVGRVMLANDAARRLTGGATFATQLDEVSRMLGLRAAHPEVDEIAAMVRDALRGTTTTGVELAASTPDGATLTYAALARPLGDPVKARGVALVLREVGRVRRLEAEILAAEVEHGQLRAALEELRTLREANEALHSSTSAEEASRVIGGAMERLFPERTGAVFLLNGQRTVVEARTTWGENAATDVFGPDDCWALRRGKAHLVDDVAAGLVCRHVEVHEVHATLCVPLVVQSELLGVLHLAAPRGTNKLGERERELGVLAAEQTALGLANLRLREKLRGEAVRDPLTGLFNRRAMEETLERELRRAIRKSRPLSLMFVDLDHFKRLNDEHGHAAGDAALAAVGALLGRFFRVDDLVCRFGGEEFAVMLAESNAENARIRAEALREAIASLRIMDRGAQLPALSASIGVASCPDHAATIDGLVRAADSACYQAKRAGRNQVVVAPSRSSVEPDTGDVMMTAPGAQVLTFASMRSAHR
jgi:diguanylate cyclase (GGDEF)-like protein